MLFSGPEFLDIDAVCLGTEASRFSSSISNLFLLRTSHNRDSLHRFGASTMPGKGGVAEVARLVSGLRDLSSSPKRERLRGSSTILTKPFKVL
jgi:hypothetical protein